MASISTQDVFTKRLERLEDDQKVIITNAIHLLLSLKTPLPSATFRENLCYTFAPPKEIRQEILSDACSDLITLDSSTYFYNLPIK